MYGLRKFLLQTQVFAVFSSVLFLGCSYRPSISDVTTMTSTTRDQDKESKGIIAIQINLKFLDNIERFAGSNFTVHMQYPECLQAIDTDNIMHVDRMGVGKLSIRYRLKTDDTSQCSGKIVSFKLIQPDFHINEIYTFP